MINITKYKSQRSVLRFQEYLNLQVLLSFTEATEVEK